MVLRWIKRTVKLLKRLREYTTFATTFVTCREKEREREMRIIKYKILVIYFLEESHQDVCDAIGKAVSHL